jgi:WD40 repeat protein
MTLDNWTFDPPAPQELLVAGHGGAVLQAAFSDDGKLLASIGYDHRILVWDLETRSIRRVLYLRSYSSSFALSPDGLTIVADNGDMWDVESGERLTLRRRRMLALAISPNGRFLAAMRDHPECGKLSITELRTGRPARLPGWRNLSREQRHLVPETDTSLISDASVAFSPDGSTLAACGRPMPVDWDPDTQQLHARTLLFDLNGGEVRKPLAGRNCRALDRVGPHPGHVIGIVFEEDEPQEIWDLATEQRLAELDSRPEHRSACALPDAQSDETPEGTTVYSCCVVTHDVGRTLPESVALSPDGSRIAEGGTGGSVRMRDTRDGRIVWALPVDNEWIRGTAFSPDARLLASCGDDHIVWLRKTETGEPVATLGERGAHVNAVDFTPDGRGLFAILGDRTEMTWDLAEACPVAPPALPQTHWRCGYLEWGMDIRWRRESWQRVSETATSRIRGQFCAVSPDATLIAVGGHSSDIVTLLDAKSGKELGRLQLTTPDWRVGPEQPDSAASLAFSNDGNILAVGQDCFGLSLWDVRTLTRTRHIRTSGDDVCSLAFSPDDSVLALVTGYDYEEDAWLFNLKRGRRWTRLAGHDDSTRSICWSPDGTRVATGSNDGSAKIWDAATGRCIATLMAFPEGHWLIFTPEGSFAGSEDVERRLVWRQGADLFAANGRRNAGAVRQTLQARP